MNLINFHLPCYLLSVYYFWFCYLLSLYSAQLSASLLDLMLCFWQHWVLVAAAGFLLLQSLGSRCTGFCSCSLWALQLRLAASGAWAQQLCTGFSCPAAYGISLHQRSNPCPLYQQVDSCLLYLQGSPGQPFFLFIHSVSYTVIY